MEPLDQRTPPAGEEIHMPEPSIIPFLNATALAVALLGITLGLVLVVVGLIVFVVTTVIWIRDVRRDINDLPLGH